MDELMWHLSFCSSVIFLSTMSSLIHINAGDKSLSLGWTVFNSTYISYFLDLVIGDGWIGWSHLLAAVNSAVVKGGYQCLFNRLISSPLNAYAVADLWDHKVQLFFIVWETSILLFTVIAIISVSTQCACGPFSLPPHQYLLSFSFSTLEWGGFLGGVRQWSDSDCGNLQCVWLIL